MKSHQLPTSIFLQFIKSNFGYSIKLTKILVIMYKLAILALFGVIAVAHAGLPVAVVSY